MSTAEYTLHVLSGELGGQVFPVGHDLFVGRSTSCDVFVPDRRMSRRHARFFLEDGALFVEDLESHNGTYVNGKRAIRERLFRSDIVRIGASQFEVARSGGFADSSSKLDAPTAHLVKPIATATIPDLGTMRPEDYFSAIGIGESDAAQPRTQEQITFLVKQTRNFAVLHEVAKKLQAGTGQTQMLHDVLGLIGKVLNADRAYVVRHREGGHLEPLAIRAVDSRDEDPRAIRMSETVAELVIRDRCGVIASDAIADERFSASESVVLNDVRSVLAVPMIVGDRVTGLIELETVRTINGFSEDDLDLLGIVASMIGAAVENLELAEARERTIGELEQAQTQLISAQDRLVRAEQMAAVGRIASGIAHEVKNHLSPFLLADMLRRQYPDDEDIQEATELMLEAQRRILGLVDEIRRFASGASAEISMSLQDLAAVTANVVRFVRCDARIRAIVVEVDAPETVLAEFDGDRMRQVLINLIRNASDATDSRHGQIAIRVRGDEQHAWVEVEDNGVGIPDEIAARIFEPFFTTKGDKGLGLGLDITRNIVEAHGGTMSFRRRDGGGTIFRVSLPREQPGHAD